MPRCRIAVARDRLFCAGMTGQVFHYLSVFQKINGMINPPSHSLSTANLLPGDQISGFQPTLPAGQLAYIMTDSSDQGHRKPQANRVRIRWRLLSQLRRRGAERRNTPAHCPFKREDAVVFGQRHAAVYHCLARRSEMFQLVQKARRHHLPEAVRTVEQKWGYALPKISYSSPAEGRRRRSARYFLMSSWACLTHFFQGRFLKRRRACRPANTWPGGIARRRDQNLRSASSRTGLSCETD